MLGLHTCVMLVALSAPAKIEVVKFTSASCVPCQAMQPVLAQVEAAGYPVSEVDWDQHPEIAQRHQVRVVPTLLLVNEGRVVDRIEGAVPAEALFARIQAAQAAAGGNAPAGQRGTRSERRDTPQRAGSAAGSDVAASHRETAQAGTRPEEVERQAMAASVRIRVEDPDGQSYGSGTIVDAHGRHALVLTCGHLFRDSRGKGRITVELFAPGAHEPVRGQLIRYDLKRDLALLGIETPVTVEPIPVAGSDYHVAAGQRLFSVGCDHGRDASIMPGQLRGINKYLGPENLVVSGRPVDGRSGGGLFSYDGKLVGVCNAADPEVEEGLYAAYASVHRHLDDAKLSFIYRGGQDRSPSSDHRPERLASRDASESRTLPPIRSSQANDQGVQLASWEEQAAALARGARGVEPEGAEVICIIRPKNQPDAKSQVLVIDRPSRDFIEQLNQQQSHQANRQATQLRVSRRPAMDRQP